MSPRRRDQPVTKPLQSSVFDSNISPQKYAALIAGMENGVNSKGEIVSDLVHRWQAVAVPRPDRRVPPLRRALGSHPHRRDADTLTAALRHGDRGAAKRAWDTAFSDYLHLGAVYGLLPGDLNDRLAGLPAVIGSTHFVGLHRIEMGLWTGSARPARWCASPSS